MKQEVNSHLLKKQELDVQLCISFTERFNTVHWCQPLAANYQFGGQSSLRTVLDDQGNFPTTSLGVQGFTKGVDGYLGFKFLISGQTHYGWAILNAPVNTPSNYSYTITEWAYNDIANAPISVGDTGGGGTVSTPEPTSSLALLAFGAAGVCRWRKGKGNQAQDDEHNEDIAA